MTDSVSYEGLVECEGRVARLQEAMAVIAEMLSATSSHVLGDANGLSATADRATLRSEARALAAAAAKDDWDGRVDTRALDRILLTRGMRRFHTNA